MKSEIDSSAAEKRSCWFCSLLFELYHKMNQYQQSLDLQMFDESPVGLCPWTNVHCNITNWIKNTIIDVSLKTVENVEGSL